MKAGAGKVDLLARAIVLAAINDKGAYQPLPADSLETKIKGELREWLRDGQLQFVVVAAGQEEQGKLPDLPDGCIYIRATGFDDLMEQLLQERRAFRRRNMLLAVPPPPENFVERPAEANALLDALMRKRAETVGITAALKGAGGYGKTMLARWLVSREEVRDIFHNGILWLELGERPAPGELLSRLEDMHRLLAGQPSGLNDMHALRTAIDRLIGDRRMLLVLDDVWRKRDLEIFTFEAPNLVRLVTTRIAAILPAGAIGAHVDAMQLDEAVKVLATGLQGVDPQDIEQHVQHLQQLARRLGEWPLLLVLARGVLQRHLRNGADLSTAIDRVARLYDRKGIKAFDPRNEDSRQRAATLSIEASLSFFQQDEAKRFGELAIFPGDEDIPIATIARLWQHTAGLDELETQELLAELHDFSLLQELDLGDGTIRLHDVIRKYLRDQAGSEALQERHEAWLQAHEGIDEKALHGADRRYYYRHRLLHLHEAGKDERLNALLLDVEWMQAKLRALGDPQSLLADYATYAPYEGSRKAPQALVGRALSQSGGALARDAGQLIPHLLGACGMTWARR